MNVPEPTTAKLVDKKTAAYEKQQAEVEEESRMKSLEQLVGTLMNNGKSSDTGEKEKDGDRLQQSVNTYEQISGQLDDFYETPKETASGDLERKVDELNKKLEEAEKEKSKAATREELMERSYRMAAKYLNPDKDTVREKAVGEEPTEVVPVQRAEYQTTSGLSRPVTDSAFIASLTVERNYGFNTAVGSSYQMGTNTIAACISENQTIEQGGRVRLRLLQPLQAGSITVPENSLVTGAADYDRCMKATKDNWEYGVYNQFDKKYGTLDEGTKKALKRTTPVETGTVTTHDARTAFERVMDYAGCSLHRDRVDERIVQETRTGTANYQGMNEHNGQGVVEGIDWKSVGYPKKGIIDSQDDVIPVGESSAWPELVQGVILKDSDNDGMPDEWEKKYGLNPNDASDRNGKTVDEEGTYTNLEMYMNSLVQKIVEEQNKGGVQ